ncbi:MAG: ABC transporter substrate-binding protein [Chloroflexi bacterium]|nr:ABC transporter substrate-binding protein [Chloroflexota bacterium]
MSERSYWQRMSRKQMSRRGILRASARAGVGAAGLALVGCGDDDDDQAVAQVQQQQQQVQPQAQQQAMQQQQADQAAQQQAAQQQAQEQTAQEQAEEQAEEQAAQQQAMVSDKKYGGYLIEQSANVYETYDAQRTVASPVLQVLARVQSKIVRFSNPDTGELVGDLAETWETPDATTVTLHLRDGVNWHDQGPGANHPAAAPGRALTTQDIVWNIERQRNKLLESGEEAGNFGRSAYWGGVASIDQADNSVTLNLVEPDATFVQGLANEFNLINQPELVGGTEDQYTEVDASKVIGTGPNILTRWDPGEGISAVRNPDFYGLPNKPYLDGWVWVQTFQDPNAYRIAFEQKQVDSMTDPDPNTILAIHDDLIDETYLTFQGVANTVAIFTPSNKAPWNDLRLTRAIDLAINRRQLIQQLHNGLGKVSGPVSWMQEGWAIPQEDLETIPGYRVDKDADLEEARALWDAAGGPDLGQIDWVTSELWASRAAWSATPGIIAEMFNQAFGTDQFNGITKPYLEIIPSWNERDFDPFFSWIPNIEIPDARAEMIAAFGTGGGSNYWEVSDPYIDETLIAAKQELDYETAYQMVRDVQAYVMERGQFGRSICYNYIYPWIGYNYNKIEKKTDEEGWNFLAVSLQAMEHYLDLDDPSASDRQAPSPVPL